MYDIETQTLLTNYLYKLHSYLSFISRGIHEYTHLKARDIRKDIRKDKSYIRLIRDMQMRFLSRALDNEPISPTGRNSSAISDIMQIGW